MSGTTISQVQMIMGVPYGYMSVFFKETLSLLDSYWALFRKVQVFAGISEDLTSKEEF